MSLPRYPAYKDSGVSWLGEVPAHWRVDRFKNVVRLRQEIVGNKASDYLLLSLTLQGVIPRDMDNPQGKFPSSFDTYQVVKKGDVVFCLFDVEETPRGVGLCNEEGMLTGAYTVVRPLDAFDSRFVFYYYYARDQYKAWRMYYTGLRNVIRWDNFCSIPFLAPSLEEQCEISDFLDRETAKIDALIAEQEKLIALLAEKRQATISRAVTRGLDQNVPLKDSGVPWLGKVPAHWDITRLKFLANVQTGIAKGKDVANKETIIVPYLRVANVQDGYLALEEIAMIEIEPEQLARYRLHIGDVLMNEGGDFDKLGRGAIWHGEIPDCIHQNHVFAVRPHSISSDWLNQLTSSDYAQFYFMTRSKQSTNLASISSSNIMEMPVLMPPDSEQEAILTFITKANQQSDQLMRNAESAISLLKERRAALISAAVTGKIDVRGLAA